MRKALTQVAVINLATRALIHHLNVEYIRKILFFFFFFFQF